MSVGFNLTGTDEFLVRIGEELSLEDNIDHRRRQAVSIFRPRRHKPIPQSVASIIATHHEGGVTESDCIACSSPCCSQGGFAILENVIEIYAAYRHGDLVREGYEFPVGLTLREFVGKYFDVWQYNPGTEAEPLPILFFHMRSLSLNGNLLAIPDLQDGFWKTRSAILDENPWLNRGCVFLSSDAPPWPDGDSNSGRHCILHESDSATRVGRKPIDCVFFTCDVPRRAREATQEFSDSWFAALAKAFPNSVERYKELIAEDDDA